MIIKCVIYEDEQIEKETEVVRMTDMYEIQIQITIVIMITNVSHTCMRL